MLGMQGRSPIQGFLTQNDRVKTVHNIQKATIVEYMGIIYAALNDRQAEYQSNMIKVEGKIKNYPVSILID
jgi:hypothetical protein